MKQLVYDFRAIKQLRREKASREERDITWIDVCKETGISRPTILRACQEPFTPKPRTLIALSEYFDVSIDYWPHYLIDNGETE